jgi:hypothetical protein
MARQWTKRIVASADVPPGELVAHDRNFRLHPDAQKAALAGVIEDIGFIKSVIVNQRTGRILDGHLRVNLALESGQETIPVEYVDLTESEELEALATLDPLTAFAEIDAVQLDALLRDVQTEQEAVQNLFADLAANNPLPETAGAEAPQEFSEYGEDIATEYSCPKCGYQWSGKPA